MNRPREGLPDQEEQHSSTEGEEVVNQIETLNSEQHLLQNELTRCRELSAHIATLQDEISEIRAVLSKRYWPDLEAQIQRLAMERDETLISWGQVLLGLCTHSGYLEVHLNENESFELFNGSSSVNKSEFLSPSSNQSMYDREDREGREGRVLGQVMMSTPSVSVTAEMNEESREDTAIIAEEEVQYTESDPGIHDAPTLSLTQFSLKELREQILQPKSWGEKQSEDVQQDETSTGIQAIELIKRLGVPKEVSTDLLKEQLIELEAEVDCCQSWSNFEQEVQHAVVTLITSRLRAIQDRIGESPFDQDRIAKMFRRLTRFSSDFRPGFIHGLSREKVPEFESWKSDEVYAWKRLEKLLDIEPTLPKLSPERSEKLDLLKDLLSKEEEIPDFSNVLRAAVTDCLKSGFSQESPHLVMVLESHLSHLSGKRFKKLRLAANSPRL